MGVHVKMRADGAIDVDGTKYRLVESGERRYQVERVEDAVRVGGFELSPATSAPPLALEASDGASMRIVRAVADLFVEPRGLLPLQ